MYHALKLLTIVSALPLAVQAQGATHTHCLRYGPDTVALTGHLERHMYYGAPGFGEDPAHDAQEVGFFLDLRAPVCAAGGRSGQFGEPHHGVRRVQLVLDSAGYARLRAQLGKTVTLRGSLLPSQSGHHHTPIILDVLKPVHVERDP